MNHCFDILIAEKYGVNIAIFLNNIAFWIQKNQANQRHYYDGRYWTYNSQPAFLQLFPYWTIQNLKTVISNAKKLGLIVQGNYNEKSYDKTSWYALTELGLSLFPALNNQKQPETLINTHRLELTDPSVRINRPIPDINADIKKDTTTDFDKSASNRKKPNIPLEQLLEIYHRVLPECPKIRTPSDELKRLAKNMINRWHELNDEKEPFSLEGFEGYLLSLKHYHSGFLLPYLTKNGNQRRNNLETFIRFDTMANFRNEKFDFTNNKR